MTVSVLEISNRMEYTPAVAVAANVFVLVGTTLGLATQAIAANKKSSLLELGVVSAPKTSGNTFTAGKRCYFNITTQEVCSSATKPYAGIYIGADPDNSANVLFKLNALDGGIVVKNAADLANLSYVPKSLIKGVAGEILAFGHCVYLKAADVKFWKTDANAAATSVKVKLALVIDTLAADDAVEFMDEGLIRADTLFGAPLTVGAPVYVSATGGELTQSAPAGAGTSWVRQVGIAISTTVIEFNPDSYYVAN